MKASQLAKYAPEVRRAFIAAVRAQVAKLGIIAAGNAEAKTQGDMLLVRGQAFSGTQAEPRRLLVERVQAHDFDDGVSGNYSKIRDLLAEVKAVHGKKAEDA